MDQGAAYLGQVAVRTEPQALEIEDELEGREFGAFVDPDVGLRVEHQAADVNLVAAAGSGGESGADIVIGECEAGEVDALDPCAAGGQDGVAGGLEIARRDREVPDPGRGALGERYR